MTGSLHDTWLGTYDAQIKDLASMPGVTGEQVFTLVFSQFAADSNGTFDPASAATFATFVNKRLAHHATSTAQRPANGPLIESVLDLMKDADKPLVWLWQDAILLGSLTLALGRWESFKSMALQWLLVEAHFGESFLNRDLMGASVAYISNEKTRQTIGMRFRAMVGTRTVDPARFLVMHRKGIQIAGAFWDEAVAAVAAMPHPRLVVLDTLQSLARAGFKENTSEDMGTALAGIRRLTSECDATVILAHHPSKAGGGMGRGHGSLDGEVDGSIEFIRPDRAQNAGQIDIRPKDGEFRSLAFTWDPVTYEFSDAGPLAPSPESVAGYVRRVWTDEGRATPSEEVGRYFTSASESTIRRHLKAAVAAGLIEVASGGSGGLVAVYRPVGATPSRPLHLSL